MREIRIPAFAKVNLRLDVLGKRADGYHELRTIFHTVTLQDTLRFRPRRVQGVELRIEGNQQLSQEAAEKNLVYRAVDALRRELKIRPGVEILLQKKIPAGRGLGGGSSDAAAALLGYLQFSGKKIEPLRLMEIAAGLGADVPFFLLGGRALGIGKGDETYPLPDIPKLTLLIVSPNDIHVPTPDAYRWLHAPELASLTKFAANHKLLEFCALCLSEQGERLSNDFEGAVFRRYPRLNKIRRALLQAGASEALLAGSGSAVFGVFPSPAKARRAVVGFSHDQTFLCETISRSRYARKMKIAMVV
ncbi:MAG TPA: 4-(cytidine 5'-diphospho)-2-C-methyl-D-erythritol kinase [Candidatus Acidoferrales bacterium]|jgi:4-diphosphocytidyl-2-C-methyl-D-erythritol kinase|nr:4-(cytidine 5'-diphospho)-2-C-methyl-D-erythritol kinase [Candidatus Acidoferrales bacterium]